MTLEDFFTATELKDGLTTPDRVNELITVIKSEKDSLDNNDEATRHWSIVASVIAATENKNCLDLFISLDGLCLINEWLKDAQKLHQNDKENGFLEEFFVLMFRALERLWRLDNDSLFSSDIRQTVEGLGSHSNFMVREKAKLLCDSWMLVQDKDDESLKDVKNLESFDNILDSVTTNQDVTDRDNPSCKLTVDDENLLKNFEAQNSISDGVEKPEVKDDKENSFHDKGEDLVKISSLLERFVSHDDVGISLSSSETDLLNDKDEDMLDNGLSPKASSSSESDREADDANDGIQSNEDSENGSRLFKTSDMELDFGMIDPLDIARQVANEVERENNSRERSCSTSEKMSDSGIVKQSRESTPESKKGQESQSIPVISGPKPEPVKDAETLVSQVSEVAQESGPGTKRGFSGFNLNEEVCSEEVDNPVNIVSSMISKKPLDFLDFDLNVADGSEDKMLFVSDIPSGEESSVANNLRLPERLQLDLNSISNDQNGWQSSSLSSSSSSKQQPSRRNIDLNMINNQPVFSNDASSSDHSVISIFGKKVEVKAKSSFQPKMDFNSGRPLESSMQYGNPNPSFYGHHNGMSVYPMPMFLLSPDGKSMPYRGGSFVPQMMASQQHHPSPFIGAPGASSSSNGVGGPYPHHTFDMNMGAPGASSSSNGVGGPYPPHHNFDMNMGAPGASSSSNGVGGPYPHHNFDMNIGLTINGGNRETTIGGLRQFFPQNVDEQYKQASSSSIVGGKRPEPHSGFEFFPVNKHQTPPWR